MTFEEWFEPSGLHWSLKSLAFEWFHKRNSLQSIATMGDNFMPFYSGHTMRWYGKTPLKKVWKNSSPVLWPMVLTGAIAGVILGLIWLWASVYFFGKDFF